MHKHESAPHRLLVMVSWVTVLSGLAQLIMPGVLLRLLAADSGRASSHFFRTIGMFMALFGGASLHALRDPERHSAIFLWAALQKFGASAAVAGGVGARVFSPLALLVSGFDLASGMVTAWYWLRSRR